MNVTINVDDAMFKDLVDKELGALSHEQLRDFLFQGIASYLNSSDAIKDLFTYESRGYGGYNKERLPSQVMIEAAKRFDLSPAFKQVQDDMLQYLELNARDIMIEAISQTFLANMFETNAFKDSVRRAFSQMDKK